MILAGFALNAVISWRFFQAHAYRSYDVIFDADPNLHYAYLAGLSGTTLRHPLELLFLHPLAAVALWLGPRTGLHLTAWLVILLGAVESTVKSIFLVLTLRRIGMGNAWVLLLTAIDVLSFARLTVGSLPESFALSAACITAIFWLAACLVQGDRFRPAAWVACGVCTMGATITNGAAFACVLAVVLCRTGKTLRQALRITALLTAQAMLITAILFGCAKLAFHAQPMGQLMPRLMQAAQRAEGMTMPVAERPSNPFPAWPVPPKTHKAADFLRIAPFFEALILPLADTYAFTGPRPLAVPIDRNNPADHFTVWERSAPPFGFVMDQEWSLRWVWPLAVVLACLGFGVAGWMQAGRQRTLGIAALVILLFNFALHSLWGANELYLYVLHWQPALLILMAGLAFLPQRLAIVTPCCLLMTEVIRNADNLRSMWERLGR